MPDPQPDPLAVERLTLERERLSLERRRLAADIRLKRQEMAKKDPWVRQALSNPMTLAVVGGFLTLITGIVTSQRSAEQQREADARQAAFEREAQSRTLQADLIKRFAETPDLTTARGNLEFLVNAGLLPDYQKRIAEYLRTDSPAPRVGTLAFSFPVSSVRCPTVHMTAFFPEGLESNVVEDEGRCVITVGDGKGSPGACQGVNGVVLGPAKMGITHHMRTGRGDPTCVVTIDPGPLSEPPRSARQP